MPTEPEPTEPESPDAGLGLGLFGKPFTQADVEAADAADVTDECVDQDAGLTLNADEWEELDELWSQPIGFEDQAGMPARPVPYAQQGKGQSPKAS